MSLLKMFTGVVGGVAAGLFFAKKSGAEFRKEFEGKTSEERLKIFGGEVLSMGKDVLEELKKLPEKEQIKKLKSLGKDKLEILSDEIKKNGGEKISNLKEYGESKLDELLPKLEKTLEEIKNNGAEKFCEIKKSTEGKISNAKLIGGEKINLAKKGVKKIFKKEENMGAKMTKIFKK